jgi:DNA-directed RNA polymerase subunit RPC12/RpoP
VRVHFYSCPWCGRRGVKVQFSGDGKADLVKCRYCGVEKIMGRLEFVKSIHEADTEIQRTRRAVIQEFRQKGIRVVSPTFHSRQRVPQPIWHGSETSRA